MKYAYQNKENTLLKNLQKENRVKTILIRIYINTPI